MQRRGMDPVKMDRHASGCRMSIYRGMSDDPVIEIPDVHLSLWLELEKDMDHEKRIV